MPKKMDEELRDRRVSFVMEFCECWFCGWRLGTRHEHGHVVATLDCHEIACGPARKRAVAERAAWGVACRFCNCHRLTDRVLWPIERQLAVKRIYDPEFYDRVRVNELRGRAPEAITEAEVDAEVLSLINDPSIKHIPIVRWLP